MAVTTLHRMFDIAAPRLDAVRERQSSRPSAGSSLPPRRRDGLLSVVALRRVFSARSRFVPRRDRALTFAFPSEQTDGAPGGDALPYPAQMVALGRVVAAVQRDHS